MSYILSALKKVEHKRRLRDTPELLSVQIEDVTPDHPRLRRLSVVLSTISLISVIALSGIWYHSTRLPPSMSDTPKLQTVLVAPLAADGSVQAMTPLAPLPQTQAASPVVQAPATPSVELPHVYYRQPPPVATQALPSAASNPYLYRKDSIDGNLTEPLSVGIVNYNQLPEGLRARIPSMQLSAHIYSDTRPRARKVIINGVSLREKQSLSDDLSVYQINADGVVMDYQGTLFLIDKKSIFD